MKNITRVGLTAWMAAAIASVAFAGPITGIWHGQLRFDATKLPSETNVSHDKVNKTGMMAQTESFTLTLKGDHTFALSVRGTPKPIPTIIGRWSQSGKTLSLTYNRGKVETETYTLANDQRSFYFAHGPVRMMYTR